MDFLLVALYAVIKSMDFLLVLFVIIGFYEWMRKK